LGTLKRNHLKEGKKRLKLKSKSSKRKIKTPTKKTESSSQLSELTPADRERSYSLVAKTRLHNTYSIIEKGIWIAPESSEELSVHLVFCWCSRIFFLFNDTSPQQRNLHAVKF